MSISTINCSVTMAASSYHLHQVLGAWAAQQLQWRPRLWRVFAVITRGKVE